MRPLSDDDEQQLYAGVKMAVDLVENQGLSPNDAMLKVAQAFNYGPGFLRAACNAFNTGRQLSQWNSEASVLDKLAGFELANYEKVLTSLSGSQAEKQAASSSSAYVPIITYADRESDFFKRQLLPSQTEKSAELQVPQPATVAFQKLAVAVERSQLAVDACRKHKTAAKLAFDTSLAALQSYFSKASYDRLPVATVEHAVALRYGKLGQSLMACIVTPAGQGEKRAADLPRNWQGFFNPVDYTAQPYTLVADVLQKAKALQKAAATLERAESATISANEKLAAAVALITEPVKPVTVSLTPNLFAEKAAGLDAGSLAAGFALPRMLAEEQKSQHPGKLEAAINELDSPEHLNEMRKIRAQTVLTQLMSDPDNPLSGYDPEAVLQAYNEMVQLSPRLADQPASVGPLLNKRMMGNVEPFEVGETLKLEQGLQGTQSRPSYTDVMRNETSILS